MIIRVHCRAHGVDNIPPVDGYSFDQVADQGPDSLTYDPREGYEFDWDQVNCPVDSSPNEHEFVIEVFDSEGRFMTKVY